MAETTGYIKSIYDVDVSRLLANLAKTEGAWAKVAANVEKATNKAKAFETEVDNVLRNAGIKTSSFYKTQLSEANTLLSMVKKGSSEYYQILKKIEGIERERKASMPNWKDKLGISGAVESMGPLGSMAMSAAGPLAAAVGVGALVNGYKNLIKTAIDATGTFRKQTLQFEVMLGSAEKARERMESVEKLAAETPFESTEIIDAAIKLQAVNKYSESNIRMLGDLASGAQKDFGMVTSAYQRLMAGQKGEAMEMFRSLTISSKDWAKGLALVTKGAVTDPAKASIEQMDQALQVIVKDRFPDMMKRQAQTLGGIQSNIGDAWNKFLRMIGEAGVFDKYKEIFSEIYKWVGGMIDSGKAKQMAEALAGPADQMLTTMKYTVKAVQWIIERWEYFAPILAVSLAPIVAQLKLIDKLAGADSERDKKLSASVEEQSKANIMILETMKTQVAYQLMLDRQYKEGSISAVTYYASVAKIGKEYNNIADKADQLASNIDIAATSKMSLEAIDKAIEVQKKKIAHVKFMNEAASAPTGPESKPPDPDAAKNRLETAKKQYEVDKMRLEMEIAAAKGTEEEFSMKAEMIDWELGKKLGLINLDSDIKDKELERQKVWMTAWKERAALEDVAVKQGDEKEKREAENIAKIRQLQAESVGDYQEGIYARSELADWQYQNEIARIEGLNASELEKTRLRMEADKAWADTQTGLVKELADYKAAIEAGKREEYEKTHSLQMSLGREMFEQTLALSEALGASLLDEGEGFGAIMKKAGKTALLTAVELLERKAEIAIIGESIDAFLTSGFSLPKLAAIIGLRTALGVAKAGINAMAVGGITSHDQIVRISESNRREAVIPLETAQGRKALQDAAGGGMNEQTLDRLADKIASRPQYLQVDGQVFALITIQKQAEYLERAQ